MKIALLGATGFVGSAIMNEALTEGTRSWRSSAIRKGARAGSSSRQSR